MLSLKSAKHLLLACASILVIAQRPGAAAPEVYVPERLYMSGVFFEEPSQLAGLPSAEPTKFPVEVWYFNEVCIVSRTNPYPFPATGAPGRLVYAYWSEGKSPDGDSGFQQWASPGIEPVTVYDSDYLPGDARDVNPLWHLLHYRKRSHTAEDSGADTALTSTIVQLHDPTSSEHNVEVKYDLNYLVHDDRVLSMTHVMHENYLPGESDPKAQRQEDRSLVTAQLVASNFDEQFTTVPRTIKWRWYRGNPNLYRNTTFQVEGSTISYPISHRRMFLII